jgi:hypothetical protein
VYGAVYCGGCLRYLSETSTRYLSETSTRDCDFSYYPPSVRFFCQSWRSQHPLIISIVFSVMMPMPCISHHHFSLYGTYLRLQLGTYLRLQLGIVTYDPIIISLSLRYSSESSARDCDLCPLIISLYGTHLRLQLGIVTYESQILRLTFAASP